MIADRDGKKCFIAYSTLQREPWKIFEVYLFWQSWISKSTREPRSTFQKRIHRFFVADIGLRADLEGHSFQMNLSTCPLGRLFFKKLFAYREGFGSFGMYCVGVLLAPQDIAAAGIFAELRIRVFRDRATVKRFFLREGQHFEL